MFKTKKDVDAHVKSVLGNVRAGRERDLRGLAVAKHYVKVNAYGTALEYLISYINVKDDNEMAHKLIGQCYQYLNRPDKALESYQRSLQLNQKQPDVLKEICRLLLDEKNWNANKAKYWCDLAESQNLADDAVFTLRDKLIDSNESNEHPLDEVIQKEIASRPNDVRLRIKLLRSYIEKQQLQMAFDYAFELEKTMNEHCTKSNEWYKAVWEMLSNYELVKDVGKDWDYWLLVIISLERQIGFGLLSQTTNIMDVVNVLFIFDQYMYKFSQAADKLDVQREVLELCQEHYRGQLLLHMISLIFKRELLQNKNKWKETVRKALPLLVLGYHIELPDTRQLWVKHCDEQSLKFIQIWERESAFRAAQIGRTLFGCLVDDKNAKENESIHINNTNAAAGGLLGNCDEVLSAVRNVCIDKNWRNDVFLAIFTNSQQKTKQATSFFMKSHKCQEPLYEWPSVSVIEDYEEKAQALHPQSLDHHVYLSMSNENLSDVSAKSSFPGLNFSTQTLTFCGAHSLNQLDVDSFLYATTIQAKRQLESDSEFHENYYSGNRSALAKPRMLPFCLISSKLCTEEQSNWWIVAYKFHKNLCNHDNLAEMRTRLEHGIEAIRCVNGPKMDLMIVFALGKVLVGRSQGMVKPKEKAALEARVETVFRQGIHMLIQHQKGNLEPFIRYFKYANQNSTSVERAVNNAAEDAITYLSSRYFKRASYEEFIADIEGLMLPTATYMQAEAYRKLDELNRTSKASKAKYFDHRSECLQKTQQLLKNNPEHPISCLISSEIKRVKQTANKYHHHGNEDCFESPLENVHNNSSTYEDAEDDFFSDEGGLTPALNRSRRETVGGGITHSAIAEIKNLIKKQNEDIISLKNLILNTIQPDLQLIRPQIVTISDKIADIENILKRSRITTSRPPSPDNASQVLDDLYSIADDFQQQQQQQLGQSIPSFPNGGGYTSSSSGIGTTNASLMRSMQQQQVTPLQQQQQDRFFAASNAAMHPMLAAYSSPMFGGNPNSLNYFSPQNQFIMSQQAAPTGTVPPNILGQRASNFPMNMYGSSQVPFMDVAGALNFNHQATQLPTAAQASITSLMSSAVPSMAMALQNSITVGPGASVTLPPNSEIISASLINPQVPQLAPTVPLATNNIQTVSSLFNKALNNQPVEKGPPANVVITSSDPLPKPTIGGTLNVQQPTLSVTIPPQHIKPSLVPAPDTSIAAPLAATPAINLPVSSSGGNNSSSFNFKLLGTNAPTFSNAPFKSFGDSSTLTLTNTAAANTSSLFGNNVPAPAAAPPPLAAVAPPPSAVTTAANAALPSFSNTTFSFKPQVAQAAAEKAKELINSSSTTIQDDNISNDLSNSSFGVDPDVEYDPRPDFKPIIPLPDEIVVKTGEEDEEIMFCHLAKLYRLSDKEWKERGKGDIKILKNKQGYSRILMRREQTHKICANHAITPELTLTQAEKESKALIWYAHDFADEEVRLEKLFVRFKLPETALEFKKAFNKAQEEVELLIKQKEQQSDIIDSITIKPSAPAIDVSKPAAIKPFDFNQFTTSTPSAVNKSGNPFNVLVSNPPSVAAVTSEPTVTQASRFGLANFSFGQVSSAPTLAAATVTTAMTVNTPTKASTASPFANIFSHIGKGATPTPAPASPSPFTTLNADGAGGDAANTTFNTTLFSTPIGKQHLDTSITSITKTFTENNGGGDNKSSTSDGEDDYVPTAEFKPVIELPELVEVNTGEENENVLFEYRAKLLRFVKETTEWKERGVGNIKVLQNKDNANKVRLVMRRDQVHKLCCNQFIQKDTKFNFAKNSEAAIQWAGQDYSEEELSTEMLCLRFKSPEICKQFYNAILLAQVKMTDDEDEDDDDGDGDQEDGEDLQKEADIETPKAAEVVVTKGFGDAFKPKAGDWSCDGCYLLNKADQLYCVSCEIPKDDTVPPKKAENPLLAQPTTKFSFGFASAPVADQVTGTVKSVMTFGAPSVATTTTSISTTSASPLISDLQKGFGDAFKPKAGSWKCAKCYVGNAEDAVKCVCCETPKAEPWNCQNCSMCNPPGQVTCVSCDTPKEGGTESGGGSHKFMFSSEAPKFSFGFNKNTSSSNAFSFGATPLTVTKSADAAKVTPFGSIASIATKGEGSQSFSFVPPVGANSSSLSSDNAAPNAFSFALPTNKTAVETEGGGAASFSLDKKDFNFTLKPKSPGNKGQKTPTKLNGNGNDVDGEDAGDDDYHEEEENNTYFTPVIPLPDKVEVKTGEEDEEVLYVHRAKLYRMSDGEWKERGLGDVKILRHKQNKGLRVVMRRDQVLKICLNHGLNENIGYKLKDDKSWLFIAHDFSENESKLERFTLRFKNAEIAKGFMTAIRNALNNTATVIHDADKTTSYIEDISTSYDNDSLLTDDILQELPHNVTIDEEDERPSLPMHLPALTLPKSNDNIGTITSRNISSLLKPGALTPNKLTTNANAANNDSSNIFGGFQSSLNSSTSSTFSFTNALKDIKSADSSDGSNKFAVPAISGGFVFGSGAEDKKFSNVGGSFAILSGKGDTGTEETANQTKSIFGKLPSSNNTANTAPATSNQLIFGGTGASIFSGSGNTTTSAGSIFGGSAGTVLTKPSFGAPPIFGGVGKSLFESETKPSATNTVPTTNSPLLFSQNVTTTFTDLAKKSDAAKTGPEPKLSNTFANLTANKVAEDGQSLNESATLGFEELAAKAASSDDFASLAAKADGGGSNGAAKVVGFPKLNASAGSGGFFGLTHQDAFSSFLKPSNNAESQSGGKDLNNKNASVDTSAAEDNEENYDPHYDPIIPLPQEIVVSTGEEEETKLFGERATLFRYDEVNKEWKERGVGEIKILLHPGRKSHRLIMRREQIHKLVLNTRINREFVYNNKSTNPKSIYWGSINFAETPNGDLERLAVRFKKEELADQFRTILLQCLETATKNEKA